MKKILMILGVVMLAMIVVGGSAFGYALYTSWKANTSATAYVDENLPSILQTWSKDELLKRASPELRKSTTDAQLTAVFEKLSRFGQLLAYGGAKGQANVSVTTESGRLVTGSYVAHPRFENGEAEVTVRVVQHDGQWQILYFDVHSPLLSK